MVGMSYWSLGSPSMDPETTMSASVSDQSREPPFRWTAYPAAAATTTMASTVPTIARLDKDTGSHTPCCESGIRVSDADGRVLMPPTPPPGVSLGVRKKGDHASSLLSKDSKT